MINKINRNKKIILLTISSLLFLLILSDIFRYEITSYDNWAYSAFVEGGRSESLTMIMKIITSFGSGIVITLGILLIFLFAKDKNKGLYALINVILIVIINSIIKVLIRRPRPSGYNLIEESNFSFPSGHSMISTAFYGFLIYLVYKNIKNKKLKYFLIIVLFILIISICISRIYLGVHYLSDTLGGFFFTITYLMIFITYIPKLKIRKDSNYEKKEKD